MRHAIALLALGALTLGACAGSDKPAIRTGFVTPTTVPAHAASIRAVMATRYYGDQLDCVVTVVADRLGADDWTWIVANAGPDLRMPPYFRDLKRTTDAALVAECDVDPARLSTVADDGTVTYAEKG